MTPEIAASTPGALLALGQRRGRVGRPGSARAPSRLVGPRREKAAEGAARLPVVAHGVTVLAHSNQRRWSLSGELLFAGHGVQFA